MSGKSALKRAFYLAAALTTVSSAVMTVRDVEYKRLPRDPSASDIAVAFGQNFGRSIAWGFRQGGLFIKGAYEALWEGEQPSPQKNGNKRSSVLAPSDPVASSARPPEGSGLIHTFRIEAGNADRNAHLLPGPALCILKNNPENRPFVEKPQPFEMA